MTHFSRITLASQRGAALIIVLAFVVLLTGLVVAYFSRTVNDRQVAQASFNQTKADQVALSAADLITTDVKQEIANGSDPPDANGNYIPKSSVNMVPGRSGNPPIVGGVDPIPNLIRISNHSDPTGTALVTSRASNLSSTIASANGRFITKARWNKHYLIPRDPTLYSGSNANKVGTDPDPSFTVPDWVFVTSNGPAVLTLPNSSVIGRYAYAIYDEGGLLDVNAAGYPTNMTITQSGRKGAIAFSDLTALPTSPTTTFPQAQIDNIVGWRNYASTQPSGDFQNNFTFTPAAAQRYFNLVANNVVGTNLPAKNNGFLTVATATPAPGNGRTDQAFVSRQELLAFRSSTGFSQDALQYFGTFSRQLNSPSYSPPTGPNPNFLSTTVSSAFTRNDGSEAVVGQPLVKKRFLPQRLNWLTYKGPSASRDGIADGKALEPDMAILMGTYGLSKAFLQQGDQQNNQIKNIVKYFGLFWDSTNERWNYIGHPSSPSASSPLASAIATLGSLTGTREPDFFELLQACILDASLGGFAASDPALPIVHQQSKMLQILTIGANLLAQARTDSYPVRIACSVNVNGTATPMEAIGSPRLPFLSSLAACPVAGTRTTGGVNWFLVPNLWDPYRNNWDLTEVTALTPPYPRPPVRITVTGSADFGRVTATQSGSASSGVTSFSTPVTFTNLSQTLKTGNANSGRDGFREASRLGTSDLTAAPATYITTTSPTSPASATWNSISRPPRPNGTVPGTDNFVVFRLSIPGSSIPTGSNGQNPVLILKPGFQMTMEYQSPNNTWYPYSFLQGNNATNTWIGNTTTPQNLNLTTTFSQYGLNTAPPSTSPTVLHSSVGTVWDMTTLAQAPMFAKADPRSIRYNSQIGVVNLSSPPMTVVSAGVIGPIWPDTYATPPPMFTTTSPGPNPNPNPNPATHSQVGDNGPAGSNPYNENTTSAVGNAVRPIVMNRPFRSVGEMGYAFRDQPFKTVDFFSVNSPDACLLDLFSVNDYDDVSAMRAGVVNLNTRQAPAMIAALQNTIGAEGIEGAPAPSPVPITNVSATNAGTNLASQTSNAHLTNRAGLTTLIANETTSFGPTAPKTQRESIARALGEVGQTRSWTLMIDVIAQSGRYAPGATDLTKFIVEGEQRYWVHVAIDRFTGEVIDRQIEVVKE